MASHALRGHLKFKRIADPPGCVSPETMWKLKTSNPGTTYYYWNRVLPPDTRTRLQKIYKSEPDYQLVWTFVGELADMTFIRGPQHDPFVTAELTFDDNGGSFAAYHDFGLDECGYFKIATLGPPAPARPRPSAPPVEEDEDPVNVGGRKRRSRVKKQTRRTQRKRRNTKRH